MDAASGPVEYEAVHLRLPGDSRDFLPASQTDAMGKFVFLAVPPNKYQLVMGVLGFKRTVQSLMPAMVSGFKSTSR